jgi:hypothetical protein
MDPVSELNEEKARESVFKKRNKSICDENYASIENFHKIDNYK